MQRYFVSHSAISQNIVTVTGGDSYHMQKVMRMMPGDEVYVCSDFGKAYLCKINTFTGTEVLLDIVSELDQKSEMAIDITIAQGLVRREKQEEVVQKITQLGAFAYLPVMMEYSIVKVNDEKADRKKERLSKIAKEAAEQSQRTRIPEILDSLSFKDLLKLKHQYDLCLYAYEETAKKHQSALKQTLKGFRGKTILVLFGPEGGISLSEAKALDAAGFIPVELGPRILRTETAPLYFLSAASYELELGETYEI